MIQYKDIMIALNKNKGHLNSFFVYSFLFTLYFDMQFQDFHGSPDFISRTAGWARKMSITTGDLQLLLMTSYC